MLDKLYSGDRDAQNAYQQFLIESYSRKFMFEKDYRARSYYRTRLCELFGGTMPQLNLAVNASGALLIEINVQA